MDASIKWSVNSTVQAQRFLLADGNGRSLAIGRVESYNGRDLRYKLGQSYRDVPQFRTYDWAPFDEQLVAVGQWSGEATLVHLDEGASPIIFPTKHQRLCNAISFNKNGFLAVGLDRVRNVEGLVLWDVQQRTLASPSASSKPKSAESYRRLASSEAVASIRFYTGQPDTLLAGIKGAGFRLFDIRENGTTSAINFPTSQTYNVTIDFDENYFACSGTGKDSTVQIWDRRSVSTPGMLTTVDGRHGPVVEYSRTLTLTKNTVAPSVVNMAYCSGKPGFLSLLGSNGELKVFETGNPFKETSGMNDIPRNLEAPSREGDTIQLHTRRIYTVVPVVNTRNDRANKSEHVLSMDATNLAGTNGTPTIITISSNRKIQMFQIPQPTLPFAISARGVMLSSRPRLPPTMVVPNNDCVSTCGRDAGKESNGKHGIKENTSSHNIDTKYALQSLKLARSRAESGYALDPRKNIDMSRGSEQERTLWEWIESGSSLLAFSILFVTGFRVTEKCRQRHTEQQGLRFQLLRDAGSLDGVCG